MQPIRLKGFDRLDSNQPSPGSDIEIYMYKAASPPVIEDYTTYRGKVLSSTDEEIVLKEGSVFQNAQNGGIEGYGRLQPDDEDSVFTGTKIKDPFSHIYWRHALTHTGGKGKTKTSRKSRKSRRKK